MHQFENLTFKEEFQGTFAVQHTNGAYFPFLVEATTTLSSLFREIASNRWLRERLAYINDNGTMKDYK